ncbi:MAG: PAS domain S-box protein [bacterium]
MNEWELVFKSISDPVLILDVEHRVLAANAAAHRAANLPEGELLGRHCYDVYHCTTHPPEGCPLAALKQSNKPETLEMMMQAAHGTYLVTVAPILDNGKLVRTVHIARDITARKKAELALRASEERFRAIFDAATDGILIADDEQKQFLMGNRAIREMLGYTNAEICGMSVADIHPPEELRAVVEVFERQLQGDFTLSPELPVLRKDGTVFRAEINSAPMIIEGRRYLVGVFRDVTSRRALERETLEAKDRVIREMQHHDEYVREVADRLRNPLQILLGYLELMEERNPAMREDGQMLAIQRATERLVEGLKQLT